MKNPFTKASKKKKCLKIGVYGGPGEGKTYFGLGFPKPAVIDLEGSTDLYGDRFDFSVLDTKSFAEIMEAVKFLETGNHDFETLVIDPVTIIWSALQDGRLEWKARADIGKAVAGGNYKDDFNFKDWGQLKRLNSMLMTKLVNLDMHLVLIGRMKDEYIEQGDKRLRVGVKMDAEKSLPYLPDICFRLETENGKRMAIFEKDRSGFFPKGKKIENINFADFLPILNKTMEGEETHHQTEEDAINKDAKFFQETEMGHNEFHPQTTKSNDNGNGHKNTAITVAMLFTQFNNLNLSKEYTTDLYKAYCYQKYGVSSMKDLTSENRIDQNKVLGTMRNDSTWIPDFKEKLDTFRPPAPTATGENQALIKKVVDKLAVVCGQDTDKIGYALSRMCTEVAHPGDLSKLTLAQLKTINEMADIKVDEMAMAEGAMTNG